jgi:hypothetical protein
MDNVHISTTYRPCVVLPRIEIADDVVTFDAREARSASSA